MVVRWPENLTDQELTAEIERYRCSHARAILDALLNDAARRAQEIGARLCEVKRGVAVIDLHGGEQ